MATVIDDLSDLPERIRVSSDRCRDLKLELENEHKRRNELIRQGYDHASMTYRAIAKATGLSQPQILRIVCSGSSED